MTILFSALALLAAPADAPRLRVAYADLNLTSPAGVAELDRRIARAIDAACPAATSLALAEVQAVQRCRADAAKRVAMQRADLLGR